MIGCWAPSGRATGQVTSEAYEVGECLPSWPTGGSKVREFLGDYGILLGPADSVISSVRSRSVVITTTMDNHSKIRTFIEASTAMSVLNRLIQKHITIKHVRGTNEVDLRELFLVNPGLVLLKRREALSAEIERVKKSALSPAQLRSLQEQLDRTNDALTKAIEMQQAALTSIQGMLQTIATKEDDTNIGHKQPAPKGSAKP